MDDSTGRLIGLVIYASIFPVAWQWIKHKLADPGEDKQCIRYILAKRLGRYVGSKLAGKRAQKTHRSAT